MPKLADLRDYNLRIERGLREPCSRRGIPIDEKRDFAPQSTDFAPCERIMKLSAILLCFYHYVAWFRLLDFTDILVVEKIVFQRQFLLSSKL